MNDSEDADLEILRQAALSSLLKKKNIPPTTNAFFYNPSAKPNLISIEPMKKEYYEDNGFSTEYVIAEGLSVSSSDVDEIIEEVIVSEDEGAGESSEGEDAVSVASKDSFDEILNSIEEEVKDSKTGPKDKLNPIRKRRLTHTSDRGGQETNSRAIAGYSSRNRSRSPGTKKSYPRRPVNNSRKFSPIRHSYNRRSRSRSPPPLRIRTRSPGDDRKDLPRISSSFADTRRRSRSPAELRIIRSPVDDRRLRLYRSSADGRKPRSRSPRRRSRTPISNSRRPKSRSPFVQDGRRIRRKTRSPYRRRPIIDNDRRFYRRTRSRSSLKTTSLDERKRSSKSPIGSEAKVYPVGRAENKDDRTVISADTRECDTVDESSKPPFIRKSASPENRKISDALKLNTNRPSKPEREIYQRRVVEHNRSTGNRERRSRSPGRDRRGNDHRRSPGEQNKRKKSHSRSPGAKRKQRARTPSPQPQNVTKEEQELFERRKRKFQGSVNVNKFSGKIKLKINKTSHSDDPEYNGSQNSTSGSIDTVKERINVNDKKSELSSRLGEIMPEESHLISKNALSEFAESSTTIPGLGDPNSCSTHEEESRHSVVNSDDTKEDLRMKLQQKRATSSGRLFTVALQETLSTSSTSEDSPKKPKRKVSTTFNCT